MKVFKTKTKLKVFLHSLIPEKTIGFVPTMGALHEGHLELITASKNECEITICSIFINPTQFNNDSDFLNYPKTIEKDFKKLKELNCDIVYTPSIKDLYNDKEKAKKFNFGTLVENMEGKFRVGHFNGMATVVEKFFKIIKPNKAYFGQKDLQQLQIVKELVKQMNLYIEVKSISTVREKNGLAKSSRNKLLSKEQKNNAALIYYCLNYCLKNKTIGIKKLKSYIQTKFKQQKNLKLEYVEFVDLKSMLPIKKWQNEKENAVCIAAYIDNVRLIDNIIL
ncbi:MAG: pantoate--beta-alanine ligase [Flavobacteriales bacterium]|nr:pantoate--beta-alanine ligase [Flavobacteriales bacterium]|tara:strand:+ start:4075 stop:4911 length:837 start_codon:yes stop_codon:yes gene_type:complete